MTGVVLLVLLAAMAAAAPANSGDQPAPADLVLLGGKVVTLDPQRPRATALAARAGRIAAVGEPAAMRRLIGPATRVIALDGQLVLPGFIEAHGHFLALGRALQQLDLRPARTFAAIVGQVRRAAATAAPGDWIVGRGWHQDKWRRPPPASRPTPRIRPAAASCATPMAGPPGPCARTPPTRCAPPGNAGALIAARPGGGPTGGAPWPRPPVNACATG